MTPFTVATSTNIGVEFFGIGAAVPSKVVTNDDLTQLVETSDEWISTRTGIRKRNVVSGDETVADLAIKASKDALASAGISGEDIDLIIVATSTPDTIYPAVACQVQHAIGAKKAIGFDMALAGSGFLFASTTAYQYLKTGMAKNALIVGADIHSRYVDWYDRNVSVLFADGAGAAIMRGMPDGEDAFLGFDLQVDGSKGKELTLYVNRPNCPLAEPRTEAKETVEMNGREMFKFAVGVVPESIRKVIGDAGLTTDDVDFMVLHQANIRILNAMSEKLGVSEEKLVTNLARMGNTSAASIPIALNEAVRTGQVQPGHRLVLCGFGAGVAWGSTLVKWTCVDNRPPMSQAEKDALVVPPFVSEKSPAAV